MTRVLFNLLQTIPPLGKHAFQVAFLASQIAEKLNMDSSIAFLSGLLHDLGLILPYDGEKTILDDIDNAFIIVKDTPGKPLHLHSILGSFVTDYVERLKTLSPIVLKHHFPAFHLDPSKREDILANVVFISDQVSRYVMINHDTVPKEILVPLEEMKSFFFPEVFEACREVLLTEFAQWQLEYILNEFAADCFREYINECPECTVKDITQFGKIVSFIVDAKSEFTSEHTWRVASIAKEMGKAAGKDAESLFRAGLYHDIGKISVNYRILEKPAKLNEEEFHMIRKHVYFSYLILLPMNREEWFLPAVRHHEKVDGSGYPFKLKGEEMSLEDKILQVADVFSALMEERPYRPAMGVERALNIVSNEVREKKLDREAFEILESVVKDLDFEEIEVGKELRKEMRSFLDRTIERFGDYVL